MNTLELKNKISTFMQETFSSQPWSGIGNLDSLSVIRLVAWLESSFGVSFQMVDLKEENFESVDKIVGLIVKKLDAAEEKK